ncbi:MAG: hypothetical protein HOK84_17465 [Bacteroidetes bacterium]|nr:hypothetical protein [Bacteroidota bacterium]
MKRISLLILAFLCFNNLAYSQDFGSYSPDIKWKQINTRSVRVIFPVGLENAANRVANNLVYIDQNNRTSIGSRSKKLSLILNNQGIIPNGYVTLMPFRSEFFTTPFQQSHALGSLPWLDLLSIHEYRHALQYSNFNQGLTKLGYILGGQQIWALVANLTTPNWYFEGDAVMSETALTEQGRGRIPAFYQGYRSILGTENTYSYMKARNGSYKDAIPDHYPLGYLLCKYGREEYGDDLWMRVIKGTANFQGIVFPFSKALRRITTHSTRSFYNSAMLKYQDDWSNQLQTLVSIPAQTINIESRTVTFYKHPLFEKEKGSLLVYKSSFKQTGAIYEIQADGTESKITDTGISLDPYFSGSQNYLSWTEYSGDMRFSTITWSDIVIYNRNTQKLKYLTEGERLFSPDISPDEAEILALESTQELSHQLVIIDRESGDIKQRIPNPENHYYTYPQWDNSNKYLISSGRTKTGKMFIARITRSTGSVQMILNPFNHIIGSITPGKEHIYFSASFGGKDDIYAIKRTGGTIFQLTDSPYGAYHSSISHNEEQLAYSAFTYNGRNLKQVRIQDALWKQVSPVPLHQTEGYVPAYASVEGGNILNRIPNQEYKIKNYYPILHSLKIHSWSPTSRNTLTSVGLAIQSDNVMNNLHLDAGVDYYLNERSTGYSVNAKYGKWFPIISLSYGELYRHPGILEFNARGTWERSMSAGLEIPLDFSKGTFIKQVLSQANVQRTTIPSSGYDLYSGSNMSFAVLGLQSKAIITKIKAYQNITTPLGAGVEFIINRSLSSLRASQVQVFGDAAVRGLMPNHNLVLGLSAKIEPSSNQYQFIDQHTYPRGYQIPENDFMITVSTNYHFPLLYPDIGINGIIYLLRIRANLFVDLAQGRVVDYSSSVICRRYLSAGSELIFDTKVFNILTMSIGFRYSLLGFSDLHNPSKNGKFEVFLPVLRI